jgi:putative membrane-bound dehydrogenase-like protein
MCGSKIGFPLQFFVVCFLALGASRGAPALDANRFANIVPPASGTLSLDLDNDGHADEIVSDGVRAKTRVWRASGWIETGFPAPLAAARFGVLRADGHVTVIARTENLAGAWHLENDKWVEDTSLLNGLTLDGQPIFTMRGGKDRGVRLRDVNRDGRCELIVGNESQNAVFEWSPGEKTWKRLPYALPKGAAIMDADGRDAGLRFVDLNGDGFDDVIFSGASGYSIHLFVPVEKKNVDWKLGWSLEMRVGKRGEPGAIPLIAGRGDAVQFRDGAMIVRGENEMRIPFEELLRDAGPRPKSPAESLAAIRVPPGFTVELVASEPLTMDPVAFDWGPDGKLWIVEMGDYPLGVDGKGKPGGIVRFLEDTKGDGRYDKSTVFLDHVPFPNGLALSRDGIIVSAAPDIFFVQNKNGNPGERRVLFTGFKEGNQQHRLNGFDYGLDNWLYGANGDSGGVIRRGDTSVAQVGAAKRVSPLLATIDISRRDFRFRPDDGAFETQAGSTQYGRHRDDWGNWFGCNNSVWGWHYFLPEQYLARNPFLVVKEARRTLATYPDQNRVFPISPAMRRFNWPDAINTLTSGCSITPYRDELFGPAFANSLFICEPVNNLVHREVIEPDGVSFKSHRAPDEQTSEFLASADNWSRFVYAKTGPDGALYIADMYRLVIEHPEWIPAEQQKRLDLRAGHDKGRIYRVYPTGAKLRPIPRPDNVDTAGLVAALESPNGWQRDTSQRLLVHAQDKAAVAPLEKLVTSSELPKTRVQALCTLDGLGAVTPEIVLKALRDRHPAMREHAIRVSEPLLANAPAFISSIRPGRAVGEALLRLVDDPEIRVRCQLAFSLGEWNDPRAGRALARIAMRDADDANVQTAVMSSATKQVGEMLRAVFAQRTSPRPGALLEQLIGLSVALDDRDALVFALGEVAKPQGGAALLSPTTRGDKSAAAPRARFAAWQFSAVAGLLDSLDRRSLSLRKFQSSARADLRDAIEKLDALFDAARAVAPSTRAPEAGRIDAIRLLARGLNRQDEDLRLLGQLLEPQEPSAIQSNALAALGRASQPLVAEILAGGWHGYSPSLRIEVLNVLFRRRDWLEALLKEIEQGKIPPGHISTAHQQKLLTHTDASIRKRAARLFSATNADRAKVAKDYAVVSDLAGDATRGAGLFRQTCTPCHRLRGDGNEIGPDVSMLADKPVPYFLDAILDPNKAVEARYLSFTVVTKSDREITGIITAETPNSITIKSAGGGEETVLRADVRSLTGASASLMPEGFEKILSPQDIADLIAWIRASPRGGK